MWGGVVLRWVLLYRCWFFYPFVSFFVRGSGLLTSFYVTSLYIDAALLGGPAILQCECGLLDYKKKKNKILPKVPSENFLRELAVFVEGHALERPEEFFQYQIKAGIHCLRSRKVPWWTSQVLGME